MVRFWIVDDIYAEDEFGSHILHRLEKARRFNRWMADQVVPHIGNRVLEIGAGIGNLTNALLPRERYVASDVNPQYLAYLRNAGIGKPYLEVRQADLESDQDFASLSGQFDSVLCVNVLEHLDDPDAAARRLRSALADDGRLVLYVPQCPHRFGSLDEALGHRRRFRRGELLDLLRGAGFEIESCTDFNRIGVVGWWWNGKVLKRRSFGRLQLGLFSALVPLLRRIDGLWPWKGLGLFVVARAATAVRVADEG
jgi:SAM-dependent methyltransferase